MVDLEKLRRHGLRAYEAARLRAAVRIALYLLPVFAVCWLLSPDRETCSCLAILLLGAAVWLRWRNRQRWEDATTGLQAGAIPLGAGVLLALFRPVCGGPTCVVMSAVSGLAAGIWIAMHQQRTTSPASSWIAASAIAALAGAIGCLALGVFGVAGVVAGVLVGGGLGAVLSPNSR
jgi:hypothetical protein